MIVTLKNDFHGSETKVRTRKDGSISERTARRVYRDLCGMDDCFCTNGSGVHGGEYSIDYYPGQIVVIDSNGDLAR
jgi:hypothetical protein